jgi:hypothetical protein
MTRRWAVGALSALALIGAGLPGTASAAYSRGGPYLDFGAQVAIADLPEIRFSRQGIASVRYPFGWHRNPVTTANIGLQAHAYLSIDGRTSDRRRMLRAASGLLRTQRGGRWEYDFPFTVGGMWETLHPPWISAMAQGLAMSLLTRAYAATGQRRYLQAARGALRPFRRSVPNGGVVRRYGGHRWYEEYPTPTPSYVLNGFGFTLLGLYDLALVSGGADAVSRRPGGSDRRAAALRRRRHQLLPPGARHQGTRLGVSRLTCVQPHPRAAARRAELPKSPPRARALA